MIVERVGCTPVKGFHHAALESIEVDHHGPVGDRDWCLVGPGGGRVLRSIAHQRLLGVGARWDGRDLELVLPGGEHASGAPVPTGERAHVDYWGRTAAVELYGGPHADLVSGFLGKQVRLARVDRGAVVYGAPVSLVTTGSMADAAERLGRPDVATQAARLRPTFVVTGEEPYVEDRWLGREVAIGDAVVRVHGRIGRCGLVNLDPDTGASTAGLLKSLTQHRPLNRRGEPFLAVDAVVVRPGTVRVGDGVRPPATTGAA